MTKIKHTLHCILGLELTAFFGEYMKRQFNKNDQQREILLNSAVYTKVFFSSQRTENNFVKDCHRNNFVGV